MAADYIVKDIGLAEFGRKELIIAETEMPGLMACRDEGIRVPHELSVVGFDDIALAQYVTPPLTTIHQPKIELGRLAIETLLNLVDDRPAQNHVIRPTFVQRASTARLI